LFVVFFQVGKDKRIVEMSSHCFGFAKLHFHMPFQQSSYKCSSKFDLFYMKTHHWTLTILKYSFFSSLITAHSAFPIQRGIGSRSCGLMSTKSPTLRFINSMYAIKGFMFLAHNKEFELDLLDQQHPS